MLALVLTLFTGCTADPSSSSPSPDAPSSSETPVSPVPPSSDAPSSSAPSSSNPSSQPPVSSEPEKPVYPEVNLKGPKGLEAMTCTITQYAYIDKNGVLRYSPAHKATAKEEDTITYKKYIVADGTKGVRSLRENGYGGLYVLLNNGNIRYTESRYMDTQIFLTMHKKTKISAFLAHPVGGVAEPVPNECVILRYDAKGNGTIELDYETEKLDYKKTGIAQAVDGDGVLPVVLYTDGTVAVAPAEIRNPSPERAEIAAWTDVVQIMMHNAHVIGLKKDGSLLCACFDDAFFTNAFSLREIPKEFRTNIRRIFADGYLQRSDGAVYDLNRKRELGQFPMMDQIFSYEYDHALGVDTTGKVHDLTRRKPSEWEADTMAWMLGLTDVKTVWGD